MALKQHVLRISLPDGLTMYPSQFRNEMAKQKGLDNALFHRDADGQTKNERPGLRFVGATGWVGLVADPGSEALLTPAMLPAVMTVTNFLRTPCQISVENRDFGIQARNEPIEYWVREMLIKRRHPGALKKDIATLIAERTLTSIEAACAKYGLDCPTAEHLGIQVSEVVKTRGVVLETTLGKFSEASTLVDAKVLIHADLSGFWFVGNMTARGYGRLIRPHPNIALGKQRRGAVLH